jgi:predicted acylesterase/phospholipase RssA
MYYIEMTTPTTEEPTVIKHLVISSGGPGGHMMYSVLRTLNLKGIWDFKNIKTIYGSSIGSFISIIIALQYDWQAMDDYLIKRPWEKIYNSPSSTNDSSTSSSAAAAAAASATAAFTDAKNKLDYAIRLYSNHGVYGIKEFSEMLRPALQGKDIPVNITFQEFYDRTGKEIHFMVTELNKFQMIDFSYKTHPNHSLVEACYMSCCYPFGFTPIYRDGCCYLDGGIINDYPVNECIRQQKCNIKEILGVRMHWERKPANLTDKSSLIQFISTFFNQLKTNLFENQVTQAIPNEVVCVSKIFSSQEWLNWMKDENFRRELVLRGETFANVFLSYRRNFNESSNYQTNTNLKTEVDTAIELPVSIIEDNIQTGEEKNEISSLETLEDNKLFELHNTDDTTMV